MASNTLTALNPVPDFQDKDDNVKSLPASAQPKSNYQPNLIDEFYFGTAEKTFQESVYDPSTQLKPWNPDDLYQKTGNYEIYEDMMHDDQISVCMTIKKDLVIGAGWELYSKDEENDLQDIIQDVQTRLEDDPQVSFNDSLEEILSAYEYGLSLTEKIFKLKEDGTLSLECLKTRHPNTFLIYTDDKGNVSEYCQRGKSKDLPIDPKCLIHYVNNRKFQNPYGSSDLRNAYNAWFTKRQVTRYYGIYLEKAAAPLPIGRYDASVPQTAVNDTFEAIKKLQTKTAMMIPKNIEMQYLEAKTSGEAYQAALNIFNMFIGRALIIPDLLGFQGGETAGGAYSLGKKQIEVLFKHILKRRQTLERIVNKDIIMPLCVWNYGFLESYPKFRFKPIDDDVLIELAKLWSEVVKGKIYKPSEEEINHFRALAKFPEGPVEFPEPIMQNEDATNDNPSIGEKGSSSENKDGFSGSPSKGEDPKKKDYVSKSKYGIKTNFKELKAHLESYLNAVKNEALPVMKNAFQDLYDQIEKKKILSSGKSEKIEGLKLKYLKDLKTILKKNLREAYIDAKKMAQAEVLKGSAKYAKPRADDQFLETLETENYAYVGDWEYTVMKKVRIAIIEAIKDGKPLSAVIEELESEGFDIAQTSLERYARTKFTEVTNKGRVNFFNESGIVAAYEYSAILDDRTSEICDGLDGKVFSAGTEPVPPLHWNCRSVLVPITKYEEWEPDTHVGKTPIDRFIDENKGGGFSRN